MPGDQSGMVLYVRIFPGSTIIFRMRFLFGLTNDFSLSVEQEIELDALGSVEKIYEFLKCYAVAWDFSGKLLFFICLDSGMEKNVRQGNINSNRPFNWGTNGERDSSVWADSVSGIQSPFVTTLGINELSFPEEERTASLHPVVLY